VFFNKLSLAGKLIAAFLFVGFITLVEAFVVWYSLSSLDARILKVSTQLIPQADRVRDLETTIIRASLETRQSILMDSSQKREAALQAVVSLNAESTRITNEFQNSISTDRELALFQEIQRAQKIFWENAFLVVPLIRAEQTKEAIAMLEINIVPARNDLLHAVRSQRDHQEEMVKRVTNDSLRIGAKTEAVVLIMGFLIMLTGVVVALLFANYLKRLLGGEPSEAVLAVKAVAQGDLSSFISVRDNDHASVIAEINHMRERLIDLIRRVRLGVEEVATSSDKISSGNEILAEQTDQQASSLRETSRSVRELMTTVRESSESARSVNENAAIARKVAEAGAEVVGKVVLTMDDIQRSSQSISEIIQLIDSIAFQTNILALNAAVEAARAGEAGRGFAVVASEVRSLAGRSAEAARQIKSLIEKSVAKVDYGHALVKEAGQSMEQILLQVQRVTELMASIASASDEQARSINLLCTSMDTIDEATQHNASLVLQSANATSNLRLQAEQLSDAIKAFRFGS